MLDTKNLVVLVLFWTKVGRYSLWKCLNSKQNFVSILITYIATVLMYHSISWSENVSSYRIFTKKKKKRVSLSEGVFSIWVCYFVILRKFCERITIKLVPSIYPCLLCPMSCFFVLSLCFLFFFFALGFQNHTLCTIFSKTGWYSYAKKLILMQ